MRVSHERKTMDMEAVDLNYFLQAYLISYLYASQNEDPAKIIFPKFPAFPHPRKPGVVIPIEWVESDSPIATEIATDAENIPAADSPVPAEVMAKPTSVDPAKVQRPPKMPPGGDIGPGHADNIGSREPGLDRIIVKDLRPEPGVDESKEVDTKIDKPTS